MQKCQQCNFYNTDDQDRCLKCGSVLSHQDDIPEQELPLKRHRNVSFLISFRKLFYKIENYFHFPLPTDLEWRYPWVAGWLATIPGLGQLYNHQFRKACWFFLGWALLVLLFLATLTMWINVVVTGMLVLYMLWSFNDGVITATRINGQKWTLRQTLALLSYLLFALGVLLILGQYFFTPVFKLVYISQEVLSPGLEKGDRVFVECVSYMFRSPRHGEVVYYDPPRYTIEIPGTLQSQTYVINERRGFGRVVALPGDRYERRKGIYYLNDKPVPAELEPLTSSALWDDFRFTEIPKDHYLVIIGHASYEEGIMGTDIGGGRSPILKNVIVQGWQEACLVTKKEMFGRCLFIYYPPPRRKWLVPDSDLIAPFLHQE